MATASPSRPSVFNLPNQLTTARLFLAIGLFGLIHANYWVACIVTFAIAALTGMGLASMKLASISGMMRW